MERTADAGTPTPEAGHHVLQSQTFTQPSITLSNPRTQGDQDLLIILLPHLTHKPKLIRQALHAQQHPDMIKL
ncbi:hypothetical protein PBY51_007743 [Eleginops maclovinus]|uniref:Uncharacterized protein n=1 Tax=Eleginops maclovinus TaxID=56733 RepID=A0AAN7X8F7_ELEMC|nr:hypothetical protein PBY51_007743 [Eleginops maclovinus]